MVKASRAARRAVAAVIGSGAVAGAMLFGGAAMAFAQPTPVPPPPPPPAPGAPPPGCTAADLAQASGTVGTATGSTCSPTRTSTTFHQFRGLPNEELRGRVQTYMDANPQVEAELNAIRQPVTDLRTRCDAPAPLDR